MVKITVYGNSGEIGNLIEMQRGDTVRDYLNGFSINGKLLSRVRNKRYNIAVGLRIVHEEGREFRRSSLYASRSLLDLLKTGKNIRVTIGDRNLPQKLTDGKHAEKYDICIDEK